MINLWNDNRIQFARLLAEIDAVVDFTQEQKDALVESMDLEWSDISLLFERAQEEFDDIKARVL